MSKITQSARGERCQIRFPGICNHDPETTVFAHYRLAGYCGTGVKPPDFMGAYACSRCHDEADRRTRHLDDGAAGGKGFATGGVIMSEVSRYGRVFGERHPVAKLSDEDVGRIRALNARGVSYADLAEAFGLSVSAVGKICRFERRYVITAKWRDCDADG